MSTGGSVGKVDGVVKGLNMSVETVESVEVADQNAEATLNDEVVIEVNAEMEANIENVENDGNAIKVENLLEAEKPAKSAKPRPKTAKIENRTPKVVKPVVVPTAPLAHRLSDSPTLRPALQASLGSLWTIEGHSGLFAYGRQLKKNEDFQNTDVEVLGKVPVKGSDTFVIFKHESDLEAVLKAALAAL